MTLGKLVAESGGSIQTGPFGSQLHAADYVTDGTPSVMPQNIGDNRINEAEIARVSDDDMQRLFKYWLAEGDIVYSRRGDVERRALVRAENNGWLCGTGCLRVRIGDHSVHDPSFVSYALGLETSRQWIVKHAVGATMLNLNTNILGGVPLSVPSFTVQRGIAEVLGALDDKIAANSVAKRTALSLAEACWLRASLTGDRMVPLREVARLDYGKALKASERVAGDVMVYGSGGITGSHNIALVDRAGVVLGRKGTVGSTYWASGPHYPIDTTYSVVPLAQLSLEYLYFALKAMRLGEMNSDSAVPGLNRDDAYAQMVRVPSSDGIADFSSLVPDLMRAVDGIEGEVTVLVRARDTLLPLLMSGRITIKDAESVVGEVL